MRDLINVQLLTQQTHFYFFMDFPQPHKTEQTLFDAAPHSQSSAAACDDTNSKQSERLMYTQHCDTTCNTSFLSFKPHKSYQIPSPTLQNTIILTQ